MKRRDFVKTTVAAGAAAAMSGPVLKAFATGQYEKEAPELAEGTEPGQWLASTCQGCTTWCPVEIFVQDGRAVKVRGNRHSKQNDGFICPKGHIALQQLYDPDRVKVPMRRTNPNKGKGQDPGFVPISWDEALDTVAEKMMELRRAGEPEKFMLLRGRYSYMRDILYSAVPKVFGSPNGISHSAICAEAEKFGAYYTEGLWGYRDYDLANTRYVIFWGCDPLSSNRMIPATIKRFGELVDRATVAVVDPKLSSSSVKAHEWLPVKPGEDGALALAIAHVILVKGLWSREFVGDFQDGRNRFTAGTEVEETPFVETHTHGLVKWWNLELKDMTPERAEQITLVDRKQIERVAAGLAEAGPHAMVWLGPGAAMHVRGAYSAMAVHALNGLIGSVDNLGGPLDSAKIPVNKIPSYSDFQDALSKKHSKMQKIDQRGYKEFPAMNAGKPGSGVVTNNVANAVLSEDPYQIKVAIGYMSNFVFSCTGAERWERAMAKIPFFVDITTHASETTQYADIVLPSSITQFEKLGFLKTKANRYATATLVQPVVQPLWDQKMDESEIPWLLARRLKKKGFPNLFDYFSQAFHDPETGKKPADEREFSEYALKMMTAPLWDGKKDVGGDRINGWEEFKGRGMWNSSAYGYKSRWGKFKTKTKKFEFYSETLKDALQKHADNHKTTIDDILSTCKYEARGEKAFVPHYESPYRYGDPQEYPFTLIDFKSKLNREGRSANCTWYHEFKKVDVGEKSWEDVVQINPVDASKLGIRDGDEVEIASVSARITAVAKYSEGVRPGTVAKCYGQGHWAYGRLASDYRNARPKGGSNNLLMPDDYERLSGSTVRNGGFTGVKITKI